jgi:hypothetical protein
MAARRGKNQARRNGGGNKPSWLAPLAIGLAIGGLAFGYLHFKDQLKQPMASLLPTPDPNATAKPASSEEAVADADKPRRTYDFYKLLPEKEVVIPDTELAAQAEAEAKQAAALEAERAARDAAAAKGGSEDKPNEALGLDGDAPSAAPNPATAAAPDGATPTAAPVAAAAAPSAEGPH